MFKGKMRLARLYYKKLISNAKDVIVKGHNDIIYKLPNLTETIGEEIFVNGYYEKEIIDLILRNLDKGQTFLDLGANIGAITLPIAKEKPYIKIFCVEASAKMFEYLSFNIQLNNFRNVGTINNALSDLDDLQLSFYAPSEKYGKGSLSPVFTNEIETVDSISVDTLISRYSIENVGVIKIDVEGYEYCVFKGARNLLTSKNAPKIVFEFVDWAEASAKGLKPGMAQEILREFGYTIFTIENSNRGFELVRANEVFYNGDKMFFATKHPI